LEANAVPEKVTISHRGARYEIGRGKRYYGIWVTGAPESDPVDRWPETPDGWAQAWGRFIALETPETITEVKPEGFKFPGFRRGNASGEAEGGAARAGVSGAGAAAGLLTVGIIAGIVSLFLDYTGQSLASQAEQLVPHLFYLAAWAAGAGLIVAGLPRAVAGEPGRARAGALLAAGVSATTLGMFGSDLGEVISGQEPSGAGLYVGLAGWVLCTAGAIAGLTVKARKDTAAAFSGPGGPAAYPRKRHGGPVALLVLGGLGTAASFAPSWDAYTLQTQAGSQTVTAGNAFSFPAPVIAANVLVMVAIIAVAIAAALSRPMRQGSALLAGAIIPMAAQAISALIQVGEPTSPTMFGLSPAQAAEAGVTISSTVTPIFWVYCVFVIALAISCAWLMTEPTLPAAPNAVPSPWAGPMTPAGEENRNQPPVADNTAEEPGPAKPDNGDGGPEGGEPEGSQNSFA